MEVMPPRPVGMGVCRSSLLTIMRDLRTLGLSVPGGTLAGSTLGELAGHNLGRVTGYGVKKGCGKKKGKGIGDAGSKIGYMIGDKLDSWFGTGKPKRLGLRNHLMKKSRGGALFPSGGALYPSGIMC